MSNDTTTADVRSIISDSIPQAELESSDLAEGVRVTVPEEQIGSFFGLVRRQGFEARSKRIGDTLVAHIPAEQSGTLGELFG